MSDSAEEPKSKRSRRDTSYKSKAFNKFKELKSGKRSKYEVEELESVYEIVEEKDYVKRVLDRQDDDWIVDDDGSGYVEDGRDIFDDDLDSQSIAQASANKGKGTKRKKNVSDISSKSNIQQMLSNLPNKKKEEVKIDNDDMLSEILGELDETPALSTVKPKSIKNEFSLMSRKLAAKDYMKSFTPQVKRTSLIVSNKSKTPQKSQEILREVQNNMKDSLNDVNQKNITKNSESQDIENATQETEIDIDETNSETIGEPENYTQSEDLTINENFTQDDCFNDDIDMTQIEEFESQECQDTSVTEENIADVLQTEFMSQWESLTNEITQVDVDSLLDKTDIPLIDIDGKKVFRFYWWDVYEDPEKHKGVVFFFGKTYCEKAKTFVSCCVAVRNISRRLFLLPREFELGQDGQLTTEPVTFKKLYTEVNENVMKPMQITTFRTRYVNKKYCFDPNVPVECDYMELRYPASDPPIEITSLRKKPRTFSKIFGAHSSFLEILLLERKIKGPCWLDIKNPVPVSNTMSWCQFEVNCNQVSDLQVTATEKPIPPPPLMVAAINMRCVMNPKTYNNEIVMISCISHSQYSVDKAPPDPPFQQHFCVFTCPSQQIQPMNIHEALSKYRATRVQKMDSEKALLNYFINQLSKIDPDLIVGHDLQGYQINLLVDRLSKLDNKNFSKFGRLKRSEKKRLERILFTGRLVCDIKISAKELIKSRSYDLDTLCQVVLKLKENQRMELEADDVAKMYQTSDDLLKLISFTMQDCSYILKMMYILNVIPLALQITNIAGYILSRTLMGGRSERNEYLLLHAFSEKDYIVPDKEFRKTKEKGASKKDTYSGGLVLEPKVGFYDRQILLMDFNSLYPSIIQEYNICFTTLSVSNSDETLVLPDRGLPPGILPTEIRKLVESRRQVKGLMANPDITNDLRMQYNIRQMALKLTANSMYGCLGFSNSRFYAKNLASLITHKGREILTHTRDLVEKMNFEVVYGDTDSIMINTNLLDFDQVMKIGAKIKQEINKYYKQVELDIDGVFKYLLLLKKKKYAAVTLSKNKSGALVTTKEYKGLDIVRRDWSQLAAEAGKYILEFILSDLSQDDRINNITTYLSKIKDDLENNKVPIPLLIITKQLTKDPKAYTDKNSLTHVQVALRYNQTKNGHFRAGDTVSYIICDDGTDKAPTQRGYHVEEFKTSESLKIDVQYYLSSQLFPVVTRICEPVEGIDAYQIAECLGLDTSTIKKPRQTTQDSSVDNISRPEVKFRNVDKFSFVCYACRQTNTIENALVGNVPFLEKCVNPDCKVRPVEYLPFIQNQLSLSIQKCIMKYYENELSCEDPACTNLTNRIPLRFVKKYPVCTACQKGVMYRVYTEEQLYLQLVYFQYLFDSSRWNKRPLMEQEVESGYHSLRETVDKYLNHSGYAVMNLTELFSGFMARNTLPGMQSFVETTETFIENYDDDEDDEF